MISLKLLIGGLAIALLVSSCAVQGTYYSRYTNINSNQVTCTDTIMRVYMFFEGETVNFPYEKMGLMEATGSGNTSDVDGLSSLRTKAAENCANVLINIKKSYKTSAYNDTSFSTDPMFSALAVRVKPDSAFIAKYGNGIDLETDITENENREHSESKKRSVVTVVGVLVLVWLAYLWAQVQ